MRGAGSTLLEELFWTSVILLLGSQECAGSLEQAVIGFSPIEPNVIQLGAVVTLDAQSRFRKEGRAMFRGYEFFFNYVNIQRGGLNMSGVMHKTQLVTVGDQSDVDVAEEAARHLVEKLGIKLWLGPYSDPLVDVVGRIADSSNVTMVASGSYTKELFATRPQVRGLQMPLSKTMRSGFEALSGLVQTVAYFREPTLFGEAVCGTVPDFAASKGMTIVHSFYLSVGDSPESVSDKVATLRQLSPDLVVGCVATELCRTYLREAYRQQFSPKQNLITNCAEAADILQDLGDVARWVLSPVRWSSRLPFKDSFAPTWNASYIAKQYADLYNDDMPFEAVGAWGAGVAMAAAIEAAGSTDPKRVSDALDTLRIDSLMGTLAFDENGQGADEFKLFQLQSTSPTPKLVYPRSLSEAELVFPTPSWNQRNCTQMESAFGFYGVYPDGACRRCQQNTQSIFNKTIQSRSCQPCKEGELYWPATGVCYEPCSPGQIPTGNGTCAACDAGSWQTGPSCLSCSVGRFSGGPGSTACVACPKGTYANAAGRTGCTQCARGTANPVSGGVVCASCPVGKFAEKVGTSDCVLCGAGTVATALTSRNCSVCQPGTYSAWGQGSCIPCQVGSYQPQAGMSFCILDGVGMGSTQPGTIMPPNAPNYWARITGDLVNSTSITYEYCTYSGSMCLANTTCQKGSVGRQCSACMPGYARTGSSECYSCPPVWLNLALSVLNLVLGVVGCIFIGVIFAYSAERPQDVHPMMCKQVLNHCITMSVFYQLFSRVLYKLNADSAGNRYETVQTILSGFSIGDGTFPSNNVIWSLTCFAQPILSAKDQDLINQLTAPGINYLSNSYSDARAGLQLFHEATEWTFNVICFCWPFAVVGLTHIVGYLVLSKQLFSKKALYREAHAFYLQVHARGFHAARRALPMEKWHRFVDMYFQRVWGLWWPVQHLPVYFAEIDFDNRPLLAFIKYVIQTAQQRALEAQRRATGKLKLKKNSPKWLSLLPLLLKRLGEEAYEQTRHCDFRPFLGECYPIRLAVLFVFYASTCRSILRLVQCVRLGDEKDQILVQLTQTTIVCDFMSMHTLVSLFFAVALPLGVPLFNMKMLFNIRSKLHLVQVRRLWGLMVSGYAPGRWWWESVMFARKALMFYIEVLPVTEGLRVLLFVELACLSLVLQLRFMPYDSRCGNLLNRLELHHLLVWVACGIGMKSVQVLQSPSYTTATTLVLLFMHVAYLINMVRLIRKYLTESIAILVKISDLESMSAGLSQMIFRSIIRVHTKMRSNEPYLSFDPLYGWVSVCGSHGHDPMPPYIPRGRDAMSYPNGRPRLSQAPAVPKDKDDTASQVRKASRMDRLLVQSAILNTVEDIAAGRQASPVFSVSIIEFVVRAAFLLHRKDSTKLDLLGGPPEEVDRATWKAANMRRDPLQLHFAGARKPSDEQPGGDRTGQERAGDDGDVEDDGDAEAPEAPEAPEANEANEEQAPKLALKTAEQLAEEHKMLVLGKTMQEDIMRHQSALMSTAADKKRRKRTDTPETGSGKRRLPQFQLRMPPIGLRRRHRRRSGEPASTGLRGTIDKIMSFVRNIRPDAAGDEGSDSSSSEGEEQEAQKRKLLEDMLSERCMQMVHEMFTPSLFSRGLPLQDFQFALLRIQALPRVELEMWLDLFEREWVHGRVEANRELEYKVGMLIDRETQAPIREPVVQEEVTVAEAASQVPVLPPEEDVPIQVDQKPKDAAKAADSGSDSDSGPNLVRRRRNRKRGDKDPWVPVTMAEIRWLLVVQKVKKKAVGLVGELGPALARRRARMRRDLEMSLEKQRQQRLEEQHRREVAEAQLAALNAVLSRGASPMQSPRT